MSDKHLHRSRDDVLDAPFDDDPDDGPDGGPGGGAAERAVGARPRGAASAPPVVVERDRHAVSRRDIGRSALKVMDRLDEAGHIACLVGGGVRDALVGLQPKDFDIATDASPEEVRALFRNSRIIGRRFRLVHVVFGREIIEVATFRAAHDAGEGGEIAASGRILRDNVFGSIEEDAWRRDFSVNALYWDVADGSVIDYVGGLPDIENRVFRLIGDPLTRCEEDPVRVLRAVRLSAKLEFSIEARTLEAMRATRRELGKTPPARLFEEILKLFQGGYAERSFDAVREHRLLEFLFPALDRRLGAVESADAGDVHDADDAEDTDDERARLLTLLRGALRNTDLRVAEGKPITPSYLLAFMLWADVEQFASEAIGLGMPAQDALYEAADRAIADQLRATAIPRRFSGPMKEIWQMQPKLEQLAGERALVLLDDRRFRAAYDFLCLRARVDPDLEPVASWWTRVQELEEGRRATAAADKPVVEHVWGERTTAARPKRRRRRRPGGDRARRTGGG